VTKVRLTPGSNARDQKLDATFGGPLTIAPRPYVRNTGKRTQQVERIKVKTNVGPCDRAIDQPRNCLCHLRRRCRVQLRRPADN
jgi:hypothetical protein